MKKNISYFTTKLISGLFLFVFLFACNELGLAQSTTKSTNITTINGKKYYLHKISHAQSLYGISRIYNVDVNAILKENPSASKGIIVGQELRIPLGADVATSSATTTSSSTKEVTKETTEEVKKEESGDSDQSTNSNTSSSNQTPDLLSMVDDNTKKEKEYVTSTFKSTRNINFHTCDILGKRSLDFRISHRFGALNTGANNAWGIDGPANLMLSLEYSHTGRWMVGIARCIENKTAELFFKCKIVRQVKHGWPFTITYFGGVYHTSSKQNAGVPVEYYQTVADRLSYVNELIIACKVTPWLSLQVAPAWVHYNLVDGATPNDNSRYSNHLAKNDCVALTGIIRAKFNKRQAIIFEYAYRINTNYASVGSTYYNSMGIGWEIETGGHVFQLFVTNSSGIFENSYLMTTNTSWKTSGVRLGFNITRVFALSKKSG